MASSASLKDLSKALNTFAHDPALPLPDDLIETIAAYLRRHEKYDDAASDRLQEELMSIFDKHVRGDMYAMGAWWAIIRRLLPVLQTPERILQWFDACEGVMDRAGHGKDLVTEMVASLMDLVTLADEYHDASDSNDMSNPLVERMLNMWMTRFYPASLEGNATMMDNEKIMREPLVQFGKKRPKQFFSSLDGYFVKAAHRRAAVRFLCDYLQCRPPHLHQIQQSPLFTNLLQCLQQDTSTAVVSAALTALIMLLPHMPGSLVPYLPTLFNIYSRILFWERALPDAMEPPSEEGEQTGTWEVCKYEPGVEDLSVSHLANYYTILYGLYPINFMDYIRKPQRYLRHANESNADDVEVQPTEIRHHSERYRRCHLLHPNFYTLTIDSEKTDFGRWMKSEAADVVAECVELCVGPDSNSGADDAAMPLAQPAAISAGDERGRKGLDPALLSSSAALESRMDSWRNARSMSADSLSSHRAPSATMRHGSQSSQPSNRDSADSKLKVADSPTLGANLGTSPSHTQLQDMIQSNKAIKSGLHQSLNNDSVPSLSLSQHESAPDKPAGSAVVPPRLINSPMSLTGANSQVVHLQRQILLLQNDLSFERYMKQQHIDHIGDLRRRQMAEAATEAETQNLILTNRSLKKRYEDAKKAEMQVRKESEKSRALAKKWESDLTSKLKNLREESKKSNFSLDELQRELDNTRQECDKLRKLVCDWEVKELNRTQNAQSIEIHEVEIERLKAEVERLTVLERDYQAQEQERMVAVRSAAESDSRAATLALKLEAQAAEVQRTRQLLETQAAVLQPKVAEAGDAGGRRDQKLKLEVGEALAASRARQAELQKQHELLMRKYTALQSSLLDMKSVATPVQHSRSEVASPQHEGGNGSYSSPPTNPIMMRTRPNRAPSNPEAMDTRGIAMPTEAGQQSSSTDLSGGVEGSGAGSLTASPDPRYHGRGGVQNRVRPQGKDKPSEEGGGSGSGAQRNGSTKEKEKKSGLRGIRGLV